MRWSLLFLIGCTNGATEIAGVPSVPSDLPTAPGEDPEVAGVTAAHNVIRLSFGLPDLIWDDQLAAISADWLVELDNDGCILEHNYDSPFGENLYWSSVPTPPEEVVGDWASEVEDYDYASNTCAPGKACGHYTQIVWRDTERVGCVKRSCSGGAGQLWMCSYDPPGNYVGEKPY